jgi:hypothetical protein
MRNRPEETMLMIVRCAPALAIAVGFIFALETVPAARAQVGCCANKVFLQKCPLRGHFPLVVRTHNLNCSESG